MIRTSRRTLPTPPSRSERQRKGIVLILVLVVVVALAFSAYTFTSIMQAEQEAAQMTGRRVQSRYLVDSGVDSIRLFLSQTDDVVMEAGGTYDNPAQFQGLPVYMDPVEQIGGYVTAVAPAMDDSGYPSGFRFGLTDESTKLNLNVLPMVEAQMAGGGRMLLMSLPLMTEEIADSIMDYIDADDEPSDYGYERDYYQGLNPPYLPTNGPLESIEELLMVRGVTPELLFGYDDNHNGIIDGEEGAQAGDRGLTDDMALGWANFLTLWSRERNYTREGLPRIDINQEDLEALYEELTTVFNSEWATFIVAMRLSGPHDGTDESTGAGLVGELDLTQSAGFQFSQLLELVDARVEVQFVGEDEPVILDSPFQTIGALGVQMPLLLENATTVAADSIPGRINIAQCSRTVLLGIPGMTEEIAETIISRRDVVRDDEDPNRDYETWLLVEGIVDLTTMRQMLPFVCVGGDVHKAELVGYFDDGMGASRAEVIIDRTGAFPRIVFWRDKSHLPLGYQTDTLGIGLQQTR
jgi:hypothetical protein